MQDADALRVDDLKIVSYPEPVLKTPTREIVAVTPDIVALAERMIDLMVDASGVGLAAPQVGVSMRVFVIAPSGTRSDAEVFINPVLRDFEGFEEIEEGCLSLPGVYGKVRRPARCTVEALNLDGNRFVLNAVDMPARIVQHENDHLDGTLFIDRLGTLGKMACRRAVRRLEKDF